ncbi:MAG: hypothetical protein H0T55_08055 [Rubrobacteraceae bacterium]|nr:hypothetical protein [Rubrobacteraceae bacterium]
MRKIGLLFASMVLAVLLVGTLPVPAPQLAKVEAEQATVGTWGAVVNDTTASGSKAVRWNESATTGTVNFTISEPADSVTVYIKAGTNSASRVCVRPMVDNVASGTQPLCVGANQRTYVGRTFAANLAAGSHTLSLTGSDISSTDPLFADYTSFDTNTSSPPPPGGPYAKPNTTSQTFTEGWTPAADSVHLNPRVTCSADPTPANTGTGQGGVNVFNQNVVLINPQIKGCSVGILVRAGGLKLLVDQNKVGYGSAASPAIGNNFRGVYFDRGAFGYEVKGLNEGELFMRNNYIPVNLQAGYDCLIADTDIDHPVPLDWDSTRSGMLSGSRRAKVGIKARADYTTLPVADRSFHDCVIRSNDVAGFEEEGISLDANGGGSDAVTLVQGSSPLAAVDAPTDTVTLAQPQGGQWTNLENAQGAWLSFNQGGAVGRYLQIVAVDAASLELTLSDPNDYLSLAAADDPVSVTAPYRNVTISENVVNAEGSRVGIDFHGPVYRSRLMNNTITGTQSYQYGSDNHLRVTPDGVAPQSIRVTTLADMPPGTMTPRPHVGVASYNSVVGNQVDWDISFHTRDTETWRGIPAYDSANTSTNGEADYNDGTYVFLASDPNP